MLTLIPLLILGAHVAEQQERAGERQRRNWLRLTDGPARRLAQASRLEFWLERQSRRFRREAERRLAAGEPLESACQAAEKSAHLPGLPTPMRWVIRFPDPALELSPRPVAGPTVPWLSRRLAGELLHEAARFLTGRPRRLAPATLEARLNRVFGFGATEGLLRPEQRGLAFWAMAGGRSRLAVWDCLTLGGQLRGAVLTLIDPGDQPRLLALRLALRHWQTLSGRPRPKPPVPPGRQRVAPAPSPATLASLPLAFAQAESTPAGPPPGSPLPPRRAPAPGFLPAFLPWPSPPDLPREPVLTSRSCPSTLRAALTLRARRMRVTPGRVPPRFGPHPAPAFPSASWDDYPRSGKIRLEGLRFGEVLDLGRDAAWWGRFVLLDTNTGHVGMLVGRRPALPATPDRLALSVLACLWLFAWAPALGRPGPAHATTGGGIRGELMGWFLGLAAIPLTLGMTSAFRFLDDLRENLLAGARQSLEERLTTLENQAAELAARPAATLIHLSRQDWVGQALQAWQLASGPAPAGSTPLDRLWSAATAGGVPLTSLGIVGHGGFSRFRAVPALSRAEQAIQSRLGAAMGGVMLRQMAPGLASRFPTPFRDPLTVSLQDSVRLDALNPYRNDSSGNFLGAGRKKVREDHVVVRINGKAWFVLVFCWDPRQESRRALREALLARAGAEGPEQAFDADPAGGLVAVGEGHGGGGAGADVLVEVARRARAGPFAWIREGPPADPPPAAAPVMATPARSVASPVGGPGRASDGGAPVQSGPGSWAGGQASTAPSLLVLARPAVRVRGFVLAAAMSLAPFEARLAHERALIWVTLLGMVLLVTVGGALLSGWLASPLVQITAVLREVKGGRRRFEVAGERRDQLGEAVATLQRMVGWLRERETIGRFVSSHVLEIVSQGDEAGAAQGRTREVVLLVSDIRSFTTLSEHHPPQDIFRLLNDHLGAMTPAIQAHGGTIDRFIGDAIQAAFFPSDGDHAATRAARAACAMMREHRRLNIERRARGSFPYAIGIGLARGEAVTGVLGDPDVRLDFTVLGEPLREAHEREAASKSATTTFIIAGPDLLPFLDGDMETLPVPGHRGLVEIQHPSLPPQSPPFPDPLAGPPPGGVRSVPRQSPPVLSPAAEPEEDPAMPVSGPGVPGSATTAAGLGAVAPAGPEVSPPGAATSASSGSAPPSPVPPAARPSPVVDPPAPGHDPADVAPLPAAGGAPIRIGGWLPVLATGLLWVFALALLWSQADLLAGRSAENEQALLERLLREEAAQLEEIYSPEDALTLAAQAELDRLADEMAAVPAAARSAFLAGPVAARLDRLAGRLGISAWFLMENVCPDLPPVPEKPFSTAILAEGGPAAAARRRFAQVVFASFRDVMGGQRHAPLLEKTRDGLFPQVLQPGQWLEDLFCDGLGRWLVIGNPPSGRFLWQPLICLASHSRCFPGHLYWNEFPAGILLFREESGVTPEEGLSALEQAFAARGLAIRFDPTDPTPERTLDPQEWLRETPVSRQTGATTRPPAGNGSSLPARTATEGLAWFPSGHLVGSSGRLPDGLAVLPDGLAVLPDGLVVPPTGQLVVRAGRLPDGTGFRLGGRLPPPTERVGHAFLATLDRLVRGWGWLGAGLLALVLAFPRIRVGLTPRLVVAFLAILAPALIVGAALLERAAIERHFRLERGFPPLLAARASHLEDSLRAMVGAQIHLFRRRLARTDPWLVRSPGPTVGSTFGDRLQRLYGQGLADGSSFIVVTGLERGGPPAERPLNPDQDAPDGGRLFFGDMFGDVLHRLPTAAGSIAAPAGADPGAVLTGAKAEEIRDILLVLMDAGELAGFVGAPALAARQRTGNFSQHSYRAFLGPPHDRRGVILTHWIAKTTIWHLFNHLHERGMADVRLARRDYPSMVLEPPFFFPFGPRDDQRTSWDEHQRIGSPEERRASWLSTRGEGKVLARTGTGASATLLLAYTGEEATDFVLLAREPVGRHLATHWVTVRGHRWLLAALLVITCALASQVAWRILAPLLVFTGTLDRFMRREFAVRLPVDRADEFGHLAQAFNGMADGVEEGNRLRRFVSESVRGMAADRAREESARRGEQRTVVVLFAGLPGFKDLLHRQDPASLVVHLNRFLQAMSREIRAQGGEIDKFIGDKILAVFDPATLGGSPAAAAAAVRAAGRMTAALSALAGFPISRLGVGVVHGPVLSGILGTPQVRQEFTVIGDTVNLASRLCDLALDQPAAGVVAEAEVVRQAAAGGGPPVSASTRLAVSQVKGKSRSIEAFLLAPPHDS